MAAPIFLYPSLTDEIRDSIFQAKKYNFSYTDHDSQERDLEYEASEISSSVNCLKTDGIWSAEKYGLHVRRSIALRKYRNLFGPDGLACRNAKLGVSLVWTSPDSRQRGAFPVVVFGVNEEQLSANRDHTFADGEVDFTFASAKIRGDVRFALVLHIAEKGTPSEEETHLANEAGFVLGEFDSFVLRIDGTGSLFPVFEVHKKDQPLWYVRCDWTDPISDAFSESVSININAAHKNFKFIDRKQKTFCPQLLVEVMSAALCCMIEKLRSEKYLDQILGDDEMESGSVGEVVRYFSNTLEWDFSSPDALSLSTRKFFDRRLAN